MDSTLLPVAVIIDEADDPESVFLCCHKIIAIAIVADPAGCDKVIVITDDMVGEDGYIFCHCPWDPEDVLTKLYPGDVFLVEDEATFMGYRIENLYDFFMLFVFMSGTAAVILFLLSGKLQKMMKGIE